MRKPKPRIFPPVPPQPPLQSTGLFKKCFYHKVLDPGDYQFDNDGYYIIPKWKQQLDENKDHPLLWKYHNEI